MLRQGPGELRGQLLGRNPFPDGISRLPQAFQIADMGLGDLLTDKLLQALGLEKELLGVGAHPETPGHRQSQAGELAQFFRLTPQKQPFPHLGQGESQRHRRHLGAGQLLGHLPGYVPAGVFQGLVAALGHGVQRRHRGLNFLAQPFTGLADIMHVEEEALAHLDLEVGDDGQDGAVGRQQPFVLEVALQQRGRGAQGRGKGPPFAVEPIFQPAHGRHQICFL